MKFIFQLVFICSVSAVFSQTNANFKHYRHLSYNHVSPYINIIGIHPINQETAKSTSHYQFKHDNQGRLIEVINNHYHTEKQHPLASLGVYKVVIEYSEDQEVRTFFDPNGNRISNDKAVFKEVYSYDENHFKSELKFYDLDNQHMESNWKIASYQWTPQDTFIIERRFNLKQEQVNVSPYFDFGVTGITVQKNGFPKGHYNLDDQLKVSNNEKGIASYQDQFDALGNHVKYSYYDADNNLALNQWKFAVGQKSYDKLGNHILLQQFDTAGKLTRERSIYSNAEIQLSPDASLEDSLAIKNQSLGYLKALQQLDPALMNEVMNDSLNKVTIGYNRDIKREIAKATTRDQMMEFAKNWNKSNMKFPPVPNNQVSILSIYNRIASVKLVSDNWVEYLHLIKLDGKWEVVNLIWQHKDINRYPK